MYVTNNLDDGLSFVLIELCTPSSFCTEDLGSQGEHWAEEAKIVLNRGGERLCQPKTDNHVKAD